MSIANEKKKAEERAIREAIEYIDSPTQMPEKERKKIAKKLRQYTSTTDVTKKRKETHIKKGKEKVEGMGGLFSPAPISSTARSPLEQVQDVFNYEYKSGKNAGNRAMAVMEAKRKAKDLGLGEISIYPDGKVMEVIPSKPSEASIDQKLKELEGKKEKNKEVFEKKLTGLISKTDKLSEAEKQKYLTEVLNAKSLSDYAKIRDDLKKTFIDKQVVERKMEGHGPEEIVDISYEEIRSVTARDVPPLGLPGRSFAVQTQIQTPVQTQIPMPTGGPSGPPILLPGDYVFKLDKKFLSMKQQDLLYQYMMMNATKKEREEYDTEGKVSATLWDIVRQDPRWRTTIIGGATVEERPWTIRGRVTGTDIVIPERQVYGGATLNIGNRSITIPPIRIEAKQVHIGPTKAYTTDLMRVEEREQAQDLAALERQKVLKKAFTGKLEPTDVPDWTSKERLDWMADLRKKAEKGAIVGAGRKGVDIDKSGYKPEKTYRDLMKETELQKEASARAAAIKHDITEAKFREEGERLKGREPTTYKFVRSKTFVSGEVPSLIKTREGVILAGGKPGEQLTAAMVPIAGGQPVRQTALVTTAIPQLTDAEKAQFEIARQQAHSTFLKQLQLYKDQAKAEQIMRQMNKRAAKVKPAQGYMPSQVVEGFENRKPRGAWKLRIYISPHREYDEVTLNIVAPVTFQIEDAYGVPIGVKHPYIVRAEAEAEVDTILDLMNMARIPGAEIKDVVPPKITGQYMQLKWRTQAIKLEKRKRR